jgi:GntR family transcriptional regulator
MAQPMYQQIAEDLRVRINSGELAAEQQLPTELELRDMYKASRNTIRDAIKRLTGLGLVETRAGQGTFVVRKIDPFVTTLTGDPESGNAGVEGTTYLSEVSEQHRKADVSAPRVESLKSPEDVALRLRVATGTMVISRRQERYIDETPWSLQTSYYPLEFATSGAPRLLIAEDITDGVVRYLEDTLKIKQLGYREWITARPPEPDEQTFFRISHDTTVFVTYRTGFDQRGTPMRVTVTVYPADRNQFIVNVGDVPPPEYDSQPPAE